MVLQLAALTIWSGGPLGTWAGALPAPAVGWRRPGVQVVGAGGGMLLACLDRTHRGCLPVCHSCLGGKGQEGKK